MKTEEKLRIRFRDGSWWCSGPNDSMEHMGLSPEGAYRAYLMMKNGLFHKIQQDQLIAVQETKPPVRIEQLERIYRSLGEHPDDGLSGSYHDACDTRVLYGFFNDQTELNRLNKYRGEARSMESFNAVIARAILMREEFEGAGQLTKIKLEVDKNKPKFKPGDRVVHRWKSRVPYKAVGTVLSERNADHRYKVRWDGCPNVDEDDPEDFWLSRERAMELLE